MLFKIQTKDIIFDLLYWNIMDEFGTPGNTYINA